MLSYIRIQNILELQALKDAVNQAEEIDRDPYQNEKLAVLDEAAAAGRSLLFRADAAQNDIDLAAENPSGYRGFKWRSTDRSGYDQPQSGNPYGREDGGTAG
ncbi:MAG: hypothetical protein ACLRMZ_07725 [Blautia marasmi]